MARSRKATPNTAKAIPLADRACSVSWTQMAATPAKTRPQTPQPTARATDPAAGRPMATYPRAVMTASTTLTASSTRSRATGRSRTAQRSPAKGRNRSAHPIGDSHASQAYRPTTPALTSSARPVSSS